MRYFITLLLLFSSLLFSGEYKLKYWQKGLNFFDYLVKFHIDSTKFYSKIDPNDIKYLSDIVADAPYFEDSKNGKLNSVLIPIGEKMQIYVHKTKDDYSFDIIPIDYKTIKDKVAISLKSNCYNDLKKATNSGSLATYIKRISKDTFDFKTLQKGDKVAIDYEQKSIDGLAWGEPKINAVYIQSRNKELFTILDGDEYKVFTNGISTIKTQKIVKKNYITFGYPLDKIKITSKFTYKRWHPILHRYRPHLGTDFRGKVGTPIKAVADGKVVFAGWLRGYGRVTKISHGNGYLSLYAHQSRQYVKAGQYVKRGQRIGEVGSTGRSTGPHLHLGIYINHKPRNPMNYLGKEIVAGSSISYKKIIKSVDNFEKELSNNQKLLYNSLKNMATDSNKSYRWKDLNKPIHIIIKESKENVKREELPNTKGASWRVNC